MSGKASLSARSIPADEQHAEQDEHSGDKHQAAAMVVGVN